MKRTIFLALGVLALATHACFGTYFEFTFGNRIPGVIDAPIFGPEVDYSVPIPDWANAKTGNTSNGFPPGDQVYKGVRLEGWKVMFVAGLGTVETGRELFQGNVVLTLGSGADAGYFPTTTIGFEIPYPNPRPFVTNGTFQVRVWNPQKEIDWVSFGPTSGSAASALFTGTFGGLSTELRSFSGGWVDYNTLAPYVIPEPGSAALGLIAAAMWLRRRLAQKSDTP